MKKISVSIVLSFLVFNLFSQITINEQGIYLNDNNEPYNGRYIEEFSNGLVKLDIFLKEGKLHGEYISYFENGNPHEKRMYDDGKKVNRWETFNKDGLKIAEANFRNDVKHGKWLVWDENGTLRYDMKYKNGNRSDLWRIYNEEGEIISEKNYDQ